MQLNKEAAVDKDLEEGIRKDFSKLLSGKPLAYITHRQFFFKNDFYVDDRVLIPRPETEILVEKALENLPDAGRFADLGTGSGCIGLSLAQQKAESLGLLLDASEEALEVCDRNKAEMKLSNVILQKCRVGEEEKSHWDKVMPFDLVVANPPYIALGDKRVEEGVHQNEPHQALYCGEKGLYWIRLWLSWSLKYLKPGGAYIFEFGKGQEVEILPLIDQNLWETQETIHDFSGTPRFFLLKKNSN